MFLPSSCRHFEFSRFHVQPAVCSKHQSGVLAHFYLERQTTNI
jgi:hypothetical protein